MIDQSFLDYFTRIDSREGIFLWMAMLIAFLFGFIIAYLLRSGKVRRLKKENAKLSEDLQSAELQLTSTQEQLKERNAELQEESREKVDLMDRVSLLEKERQQKLQEIVILNQQIEELQSNNRVLEQQGNDDQHSDSPAVSTNTPQAFADTGSSAVEITALQDRLSTFESSLKQLQQENQQLRTGLAELKDHKHSAEEVLPVASTVPAEPEEVQIESKKTVLYDKIIVPDREQDDLTKIEGLGDFLAKKLNGIGIFTYAEIASWTPDRIKNITEQIGYIPGRIEKDDWVGQAALLLQQQTEGGTSERSVEAPSQEKSEKMPKGVKAGDLKIVEGIGPKIEKVLKKAGIDDWATLAAAEPGRLKEILEEAGDRFRMHNPYTWPLQARLAAAGRWEEFKKYQEELKGGKEQ